MTRIPEVTDKSQIDAAHQDVWDEITASRGTVRGPFRVLLHSPELARRVAHLGTFIRFESPLDPYVRELAVLTTTRVVQCDYEYAAHSVQLKAAGASDETIEAVRDQKPERLSADDREVHELVTEILEKHRLSDATFQRAQARFGNTGLIELITAVGYYALLACVLNGFEVEPAPH